MCVMSLPNVDHMRLRLEDAFRDLQPDWEVLRDEGEGNGKAKCDGKGDHCP